MPELWDIYDENKNKTGRTAIRDVTILQKGEYHIVVTGIILNYKNEILISKRAMNKKFGGMWECNGGSILAGETSKEGILRELKEELGVIFKPEEISGYIRDTSKFWNNVHAGKYFYDNLNDIINDPIIQTKYPDLVDLCKLWLYTSNGIFYLNDDFSLASN